MSKFSLEFNSSIFTYDKSTKYCEQNLHSAYLTIQNLMNDFFIFLMAIQNMIDKTEIIVIYPLKFLELALRGVHLHTYF